MYRYSGTMESPTQSFELILKMNPTISPCTGLASSSTALF